MQCLWTVVCRIGEIEIMVASKEEASNAAKKIDDIAKELGKLEIVAYKLELNYEKCCLLYALFSTSGFPKNEKPLTCLLLCFQFLRFLQFFSAQSCCLI